MIIGLGLSLVNSMPAKEGTAPITPVEDTLTQGLLWFYEMEEVSNATRLDSSINNLDLTSLSATPQTSGERDFAVQFTDNNSKLLHAYDDIYNISDTDFTITGWVKFTSVSSNQHVIYIGTGSSSNSDRILNITYNANDDELRVVVTDTLGGSNRTAQDISVSITVGYRTLP